tara:strand:+ start:308 stop:490 length:183 start_codon:yes stop_codon:yes gene_type:complete
MDNNMNYNIAPTAMETVFIDLLRKHSKKPLTRSKMKKYISNCREHAKTGTLKQYLQEFEN